MYVRPNTYYVFKEQSKDLKVSEHILSDSLPFDPPIPTDKRWQYCLQCLNSHVSTFASAFIAHRSKTICIGFFNPNLKMDIPGIGT